MTPAQQPEKEYCIGCNNAKFEETGFGTKVPRCKITRWRLDMYDVQSMIATIGCKHDTRSRPAPAPDCKKCTRASFNGKQSKLYHRITVLQLQLAQVKEQVARAATIKENNRVLDELEQHAIKNGLVGFDEKGKIRNYRYINTKRVLQKIEQLRQQQAGGRG